MRLLKYFLIGFFAAIGIGFYTAQAYTIGEIPPDSTVFITLENQPKDYDIFNPPQIEVSRFADFSDSVTGDYMAVLWDQESLDAAQIRLDREFPEITQLNKYVFFMIAQADKPIEYRPPLADNTVDQDATEVSISWGWQYARYVTDEVVEQCVKVDYYTNSGTTKKQLLGVLDQLTRLLTSQEPNMTTLQGAAKKSRSIADLQSKAEELTLELYTIRSIVDATE